MKPFTVFVDMDSTMNNFSKGYIDYYNSIFKTDYKIRHRDLVKYEISKCIPGVTDSEAVSARSKIFSTPGFWENLPIFSNVANTMEWMNDNFNVYILTSPWIDYKDCVREKYGWIEKHLPFFPLNKIIFSHAKYLMHNNSILIDDYPKNIGAFGGKTLKILYPFNKHTISDFTAKNWKQVGKIMKKVKKDVDAHGKITRS